MTTSTQINGNREQLEGKMQARYGYAKDKVKQKVDAGATTSNNRPSKTISAPRVNPAGFFLFGFGTYRFEAA